jgi:hypothetical protein
VPFCKQEVTGSIPVGSIPSTVSLLATDSVESAGRGSLQSRLPEASLRRLLGLIACLVAARYTQTAIQQSTSRTPAHAVTK